MDPCSTDLCHMQWIVCQKLNLMFFLESALDVKQEEEFKYTFSIDGDSHKGNHMKEETRLDVNHEG